MHVRKGERETRKALGVERPQVSPDTRTYICTASCMQHTAYWALENGDGRLFFEWLARFAPVRHARGAYQAVCGIAALMHTLVPAEDLRRIAKERQSLRRSVNSAENRDCQWRRAHFYSVHIACNKTTAAATESHRSKVGTVGRLRQLTVCWHEHHVLNGDQDFLLTHVY